MRALVFILTLCLAFFACLPPQCPAPADADCGAAEAGLEEARPPVAVRAACASLKANACPEGLDQSCEPVLTKASKIVDFNLPCLATAKSKAEVRKCGPNVKCPQ